MIPAMTACPDRTSTKTKSRKEIFEYENYGTSLSVYDDGSICVELSDCAYTSLTGYINAETGLAIYKALRMHPLNTVHFIGINIVTAPFITTTVLTLFYFRIMV